jgi:hypothetical protein
MSNSKSDYIDNADSKLKALYRISEQLKEAREQYGERRKMGVINDDFNLFKKNKRTKLR